MIVIANWKQNKAFTELKGWVETFDKVVSKTSVEKSEVVVAPAYPFIIPFKMISHEFGYFKTASQDISMFEDGAHTGEVGGSQLLGVVEYSIIGHSERRKNGEMIDQINKKIEMAIKYGIKPIVCFSTEEEYMAIHNNFQTADILFAYEPANAISTAENSTGAVSLEQVKDMVEKLNIKSVIYGGSVDENTVGNYLNVPFISGFLVGAASLDPTRFAGIVSKSS